jgi:ubiquinone/menaquinone biosynthesis C-methylase UbiE
MLRINLNKEPDKPISSGNTYTYMQGAQYDHLSSLHWQIEKDSDGKITKDFVDGNLKAHCEHPVYDLLLEGIPDLESKSVLDYGCGRGRNILCFHDKVSHITGIDMCPRMIEQGNEYIREQSNAYNFVLMQNNGIDIKYIGDNSYDVVMSSRCLSQIAVYSIRYNLLKEFCRVLKPGGWLSIQMVYGLAKSAEYQMNYYKDHWRASGLKYTSFVKRIEQIETDLTTFLDFHRFSFKIVEAPEEICRDVRWVFIKAQKKS